MGEIRRDLRRRAGDRRLCAPFAADSVLRAVRLRRAGRAVRPDQIRHPARSSQTRAAAGRQRAGRGRDLHRDPHRHHCRRAGLARARRCLLRAAADRLCARLLAGGAADPADRRGRAAVDNHRQYRGLHRRHASAICARRAAVVGRHGDELVLAHRHRRAGAAAAADQNADRRRREHRHRLSRVVLGGRRASAPGLPR